jgi:hypothetical protein
MVRVGAALGGVDEGREDVKYFWLTIMHKWFVFLAGFKTGAPLWRLIIHDWSKSRRLRRWRTGGGEEREEMSTQVTARVHAALEIELSQPWGGEIQLDQVNKTASKEAVEKLSRIFQDSCMKILGVTEITAILVTTGKP